MDYSKIIEKPIVKKASKKWFQKLFFMRGRTEEKKKRSYADWVEEFEPELDFMFRDIVLKVLKNHGWPLADENMSFKNFMILIYKYGE